MVYRTQPVIGLKAYACTNTAPTLSNTPQKSFQKPTTAHNRGFWRFTAVGSRAITATAKYGYIRAKVCSKYSRVRQEGEKNKNRKTLYNRYKHGIQNGESLGICDSASWSGDYAPGDVLGSKYEIKDILGRGSSGVTYQAVDKNGKAVAIKALSLRRMTGWKQLELFKREAKTLESLDHSGIPKYVDYFEEDTDRDRGFFLVQELAPGKSLAQLVREGWRADEAEAKRIAIKILDILQYLGSCNPAVVHRDIKPENLVLEGGKAGGQVFLVDFGGVQAAAAGDALSLGSTVIGTYGYMAPEQFRGAAQPASDLYSLGATLLYLVSGQPPNAFPQERMQIAFREMLSTSTEMALVLEGLLEPLVEDRMTAADAAAVFSGSHSSSKLSRQADNPPGGRAKIKERRGKLRIDIPSAAFSQDKMFLGGFAVTWNVSIGAWTASALAVGSLGAAAFSIPFWAAGFAMARDVFKSSFREERVVVDPRSWSLWRGRSLAKRRGSKNGGLAEKGLTKDLKGAYVVPSETSFGAGQTEIKLQEGFKEHRFGASLSKLEQRWVAAKITSYLSNHQGPPDKQIGQNEGSFSWEEQSGASSSNAAGQKWGPNWDPGNSFYGEFDDGEFEDEEFWGNSHEGSHSQAHGAASTSDSLVSHSGDRLAAEMSGADVHSLQDLVSGLDDASDVHGSTEPDTSPD